MDSEIVFSHAADFQTGFLQSLNDVLPRADFSLLQKRQHIVMHSLPVFLPLISAGLSAPAQQTRRMEIGMVRRTQARPLRIIRSGPAFPDIVQITKNIEILLPAGRTWIEGPVAGKLHARNHKMQLMMPSVAVPTPENCPLIFFQPGKGHSLEIIHNALFLFRRYRIFGMPGKNPGRKTPCRIQRINQGPRSLHVAAQDFRRMCVPARIVRPYQIARGGAAVSSSMRKNLHIHDGSPGGGGAVSFASNARSRLASAVRISTASARLFHVLAQRAS